MISIRPVMIEGATLILSFVHGLIISLTVSETSCLKTNLPYFSEQPWQPLLTSWGGPDSAVNAVRALFQAVVWQTKIVEQTIVFIFFVDIHI